MNLVLDTNIIISALLKDGKTREVIVNLEHILIIPEIIYTEINNHKHELLKKSNLTEEDFEILLNILSKYLIIFPNNKIQDYIEQANKIIGKTDKDDIPIIATSLANNKCPIWSDDKHFEQQDEIKILKSKDIIELMSE